MAKKGELEPYLDREHALVKHKLFESYLKRFIMIVGNKMPSLAYVDAFAGPWQSTDPNYLDTSFGRAIEAMEGCSVELAKINGKRPRLRSLLVEADEGAYAHLSAYARSASKATSTVEAWHERFEDCVPRIASWLKPGQKTFSLVDPKAYKNLISPKVLAPLLGNSDVELLINYMWQFINLAIGHADRNEKHHENMLDLYGENYRELAKLPPGEKERALVAEYCKRLKQEAARLGAKRLWVSAFPVEYAFRDGTKYYLVYVTHSSRGLVAFMEASDEALKEQASIKMYVGQQKREKLTGVSDLFSEIEPPVDSFVPHREHVWLELLPAADDEVVVDEDRWAGLLEHNSCLPSQLQQGLKRLIDRGVLEVVGATSRRTKNFVNWKKSETVRRLV